LPERKNMKKKKIPGLFRKKYKEKVWNRKILKKIHIPADQENIRNLYSRNDRGRMILTDEIPPEIFDKLKPLAKTIKKNRGMVSRWKAVLLLILVGAALLFNLFFKNTLLKQAMETGLESIFQARSEIRRPSLSLFRGEFRYDALSVADKDSPSRNLLETGEAAFSISIPELTNRRVRIEEMSLTGVRWDTLRDEDGTLTAKDESEEAAGEKKETLLALNPEDFDYMALLEEQKENLKSLDLINRGNEEITAMTERWKKTYGEKEQEIKALSGEVLSLKSIPIQDIRSVEDGQARIDEIRNMSARITETKDSLLDLQKDFDADRQRLMQMQDLVRNAVEEDIAYLNGLIDFSPGNIRSLASGAAEKYIRARWNDYYEKGLKALEVYESLKNREQKEPEEEKGPRRNRGRDILFPVPDNPRFLIEQMTLSGGDGKTGEITAEVRGITDEPDKLSGPLSFQAGWNSDDGMVNLDGEVDLREEAGTPFRMNIRSPGNPLVLDEGIPALQISRLDCTADIAGVSVTPEEGSGILTTLEIGLKEIGIMQDQEEGIIAGAVREILGEMEQVELTAEILVTREGLEEIRVRSDVDEILSEKVGAYLRQLAEDMEAELRSSLTEFLIPYLEENEALQSALNVLGVESLEQISDVKAMESLLKEKQAELENRAQAILDDLEAEARKQLEEAEARAREEAEKARLEAEKKAQEEADRLLEEAEKQIPGKVRLPGF